MEVAEAKDGDRLCLHIGIGQLRSRAGDYISIARAGVDVIVSRRGKPSARISRVEVGPDPSSSNSVLSRYKYAIPASLSQLRNSAGRLLDEVANGAAVDIVYRRHAVALITCCIPDPLEDIHACRGAILRQTPRA
jgi:antitoxin (DNA-binding transcriptional repressor) of toxin-antitoxin stability system